jgi:hypothetical protein
VICLAPRAPGDSVRPPRLVGASGRPLNYTVRRRNPMVPASPMEPERASPSMLLYSLPFALAYIGGAIALGWLAASFGITRAGSLSYFGHLLVVGGVLLSGWLFAKRHRRLFSAEEKRRLMAYCICWAILLEAGGFAGHPEFLSLPLTLLFAALVFGVSVDALIVWLSFRYAVRKVMIRYVPEPAATTISGPMPAPLAEDASAGRPSGRSISWTHIAKPYAIGPLIVLLVIAAVIVVLKSRMVPSIRVTVADIPHVLAKVSTATRTPAFAELVFTTPDRPNPRDAVNLQFSLENGRPGFDWVLLAPRNIEDKASFVAYLKRRGYSFSERTKNGVTYLRIEDGDLAQLCADVVTRLYARPRSEPIDLIVEGFEWGQ